ncbi:glycosyltransferase family 2 protein [Roseovarius arcticus]|uniref:glycosyltransferase family 2 protein n=1 Tax=Roseovarius arcticus TaxID=2547404 RepID=UPI001110884D|nr:glycosyltransferase family 2 protein [Roseovarius arcticus]
MKYALSIVLPAQNEAGNLPDLIRSLAEIAGPLKAEIIVVDDGSKDDTAACLKELCTTYPMLRGLQHSVSLGQSAALRTGITAASAPLIATLDADGQNPPDNIPALVAAYHAAPDGVGLVQGERQNRQDSLSKRFASRFANALRRALLRDGSRDSGCALRVFRRDVYLNLPWFRHIHRFLPALIRRDGWDVIAVPVNHAARIAGKSHYNNFQRGLAGIPDLMGVAWLIWRGVDTPLAMRDVTELLDV